MCVLMDTAIMCVYGDESNRKYVFGPTNFPFHFIWFLISFLFIECAFSSPVYTEKVVRALCVWFGFAPICLTSVYWSKTKNHSPSVGNMTTLFTFTDLKHFQNNRKPIQIHHTNVIESMIWYFYFWWQRLSSNEMETNWTTKKNKPNNDSRGIF